MASRSDTPNYQAQAAGLQASGIQGEPHARVNPVLPPPRRMQLQQVPRVRMLRWALGLTLEEFAARYGIPLTMVLEWERGGATLDATAEAILSTIERHHSRTAQGKPA